MVAWHITDHLLLDRDGMLWSLPRYRRLGPIAAAEVEPPLEAERDELLDLWYDRADDRAEQWAAWRSAKGA